MQLIHVNLERMVKIAGHTITAATCSDNWWKHLLYQGDILEQWIISATIPVAPVMLQVHLIHLSLYLIISVNVEVYLYMGHTLITWSSHYNLPWKYGCINMLGDCWCLRSASGEWTIDPNPPPSLCKVNTSPHPLCTISTAPQAAWRVQQVIPQT